MKHPFDSIELTAYVTGDLSPEKIEALEKHLGGCETCSAKVTQLEEERKSFLTEMPYNGTADETDTVLYRFPKVKVISSIAALFLFAVTIQFTMRETVLNEQQIALKGVDQLSIFVENETGGVEERESNIYYPGERIQVCYSTVATAYLTLFSIDSNGKLSRFFPTYGDSSIKVKPGIDVPLPHSIRLDSYIGEETFIMIFSPTPISLAETEKRIHEAFEKGTLSSPDFETGTKVILKTVEKRERSE